MTKPNHELDNLPVPAEQPGTGGGGAVPSDDAAHASGPQKTPLHHHVSCAAITPPASPPVPPRPLEEDDSHPNFSATASQTSTAYSSRREYMDSLVPPSQDEFEKIAEVQRTREEDIKRNKSKLRSMQTQHLHDHFHSPRRSQDGQGDAAAGDEAQPRPNPQPETGARDRSNSDAVNRAATLIQRNYRGYRVRREMQGLSLDPSTRWVSAIDELQFRELNRPRAKSSASAAALAAGNNDQHSLLSRDSEGGMSRPTTARENWKKAATIARRAGHDDVESDSDSSASSSDSEETPEQRAEKRKRREEAVARRKKDSKMMGLQYFLEMVDLKHRYGSNLRVYHEEWKKADTNENFFYWLDYGGGRNVEMEACPRDRLEREQVRYLSREERQYYLVQVDDEGRLCWAKNGARIDTTEAFKDSLLRKSVKKNTWIFVADTSFRLYVGIKSSGAFQHSSFLQGSRISSAGLIKIKDGRLSSLSPLSGHYRPPASNFRAFVRNLKDAGVDTSHVSISKSYAVLVGLEVYVKSRQKGKRTLEKMTHKKEKIMAPDEFRQREEDERDKSESAEKERKVLEKEAEEREENRAAVKLMRKLNLAPQVPTGQRGSEEREEGEPVMETLAEERTREERTGGGGLGPRGRRHGGGGFWARNRRSRSRGPGYRERTRRFRRGVSHHGPGGWEMGFLFAFESSLYPPLNLHCAGFGTPYSERIQREGRRQCFNDA
ncbi:IQ domain-containing protein IQM6 [Colletotrichum liriopes]|uniref:IQ domain-containing protein IQM6 n=1 Tax=Colletotrichum liriopes TaxID=708192 RepID=A0AA37LWV0_9PEZI|nr:IQ domain-containing protein IQM6 [Colletotrichum liriopes]